MGKRESDRPVHVVVTGGRDVTPPAWAAGCFVALLTHLRVTHLRYGGAGGVDRWAAAVASDAGIEPLLYPAKWDLYGRAAGPKRNREMLFEAPEPVILIAFPGNAGTRGTIRLAEGGGLSVIRFSFGEEVLEP